MHAIMDGRLYEMVSEDYYRNLTKFVCLIVQAGRSLVDQPQQIAVNGLDHLSWQNWSGWGWWGERLFQNRGFAFPGNNEGHLGGSVDGG